ncbi:sulfate transporter 1, high-affinity [Marchantia polymorpha subsp. ruderalis]|uniref:STAS domain-containing protein n=2 Tax=Marchantia polymorpha TaxID=3197 RepID=A0A176WQ44_MARPO|nr:hypothetical protein AXG93_3791s1010 [Marchantia polymorpha subsp. ruderalis]PTQ46135.1 hypothetical protein MARPO_0012s0086 [Marchantia polymorpha]PTQ46136.1 hypothetical protein MARPO_0012s0086 [Marchantia polymorpha]BBN18491.1 hypothetical protein Mp_8g02930 [Marchantia polymorpha subsp. ruderalis]BBN18492.1 hypothetical protein Mp_8g02930 [Marchantia polymorpha subsp. ruderalis]|eukprot:PTQ46135.1 hypothetical protein MARPO_0012s0086 [Marchantia polymorpha]
MSHSNEADATHTRRLRTDDLGESGTIPTNGVSSEDRSLVHSVGVPPTSSFGSQIKDAVRETFFADDPMRHFKGHTGKKRWFVGLAYIFPILDWVPKYKLSMLKGDIVAGLTIASLAIPQDLGYAKLANLDPIHGLYSSFVPPLVYSVLGSSKDIAIGPVAVVSIILGQLLKDEMDPKLNKVEYLHLAYTATFFAGVVQAGLGLFRLGFIIDFLSHAAIIGFMAGAAVTIALQQLKGLCGITSFTTKTDVVSVMRSVFSNTDQWNWQTIVLGLFFLAFLLITKRISKIRKNLFWVAAIAPLTSVVCATLFVYLTRLDKHGVKIVTKIEQGVNPPSFNDIFWSGPNLATGFKIGLVSGLIALTEAVAIGRTFAALKDYHIDGNKEMIAIGTMNIAGSWTSCYVATGSFSRSAVNYQSGCHTALANIVMAIVVLFTLLFLTPLFYYTPNCILSAIIISAVINLIDFQAAFLVWKTDKVDFLVLAGAFFGVFFVSVEIGLLVAVVISFGKILLHVTRPHTALLGNIPGTTVYRNVIQYPNATSEPGIVIIRVDAAIYFSNSNYIRERILRYVNEAEDQVAETNGTPVQFVIIEMAPVMSIDTAAIHAFEELNMALKKRGIQLTISNPVGRVIMSFKDGGFVDLLGQEWFFLSVSEGVQICSIIVKRNQHALKEGAENKV